MSRFSAESRPKSWPDRAIRIARTLGIPLKIAAKVDKVDEAYFREKIVPLLNDPGVEFIGEINERSKTEFLGEAQALLFPIDWPEPFGLVMIEAMAFGTPVLAFRQGSVSEIVDQGVTGAIVDTMDEAVRMLPQVLALDRRAVRRATILVRAHGHGLCCALPVAARAAVHIGARDDRAAATTGIGKKAEWTRSSRRSSGPRSTPRLKNNKDGASRPHCWREDGRIRFWGIASGRIYLHETPMDGNLLRMARVVLRSVFFSLTPQRGF